MRSLRAAQPTRLRPLLALILWIASLTVASAQVHVSPVRTPNRASEVHGVVAPTHQVRASKSNPIALLRSTKRLRAGAPSGDRDLPTTAVLPSRTFSVARFATSSATPTETPRRIYLPAGFPPRAPPAS